MLWKGLRHSKLIDAGTRFRTEHSRFLTRALSSKRRYPTIPTKRVDEGGFSGLLSMSDGEKRAALWWIAAMNRMNRIETADQTKSRGESRN